MAETADVVETVKQGYAFEGAAIELGALLVGDGTPKPEAAVRIPLSMVNRHGLVAGATGTGKTKTLQLMAEQLSAAGVAGVRRRHQGRPVRHLAAGRRRARSCWPGPRRSARSGSRPGSRPSSTRSAARAPAIPIRATITSFGPMLLSKVLGLNDVQESSLGLIFHYADKHGLTAARPQGPARGHHST